MKTPDVDPHSQVRDEPPTGRDPYARESFTWRRMQPWQIWALAIAAIILAILGLMWVY